MPDPIDRALAAALTDPCRIGEILIRKSKGDGFVLCHRDDAGRDKLRRFQKVEDAIEIAKFDDAGKYRPLKTAPNLRHGWRLEVVDLTGLRLALDYFYPARLAMLAAWRNDELKPTPLRETLGRQSGMYRVAANITDKQLDALVGDFCRSDGGCLRTIMWRRDMSGVVPSTQLPPEKFEPGYDQTGRSQEAIPLLCQEGCNLLVNECRKMVKGE